MDYLERINRLYNIHLRILQENTGDPEEFARQFHISRRELYCILEELKISGAEIKFSRINHTFQYLNSFDISINTYKIHVH